MNVYNSSFLKPFHIVKTEFQVCIFFAAFYVKQTTVNIQVSSTMNSAFATTEDILNVLKSELDINEDDKKYIFQATKSKSCHAFAYLFSELFCISTSKFRVVACFSSILKVSRLYLF